MVETVTMKGQKLTLKGNVPAVGQIAPDCELIGADLKPVRLSAYKGKNLLLLSVPSLDTSVCSKEARTFSLEVNKFKDSLQVLCISMDLPFAQSRWCAAEGVKNIATLSDFKNREFGEKYGVLIAELGLLARAVFVVDPTMKIVMAELVKEITQEPDYKIVLEKINQLNARCCQ